VFSRSYSRGRFSGHELADSQSIAEEWKTSSRQEQSTQQNSAVYLRTKNSGSKRKLSCCRRRCHLLYKRTKPGKSVAAECTARNLKLSADVWKSKVQKLQCLGEVLLNIPDWLDQDGQPAFLLHRSELCFEENPKSGLCLRPADNCSPAQNVETVLLEYHREGLCSTRYHIVFETPPLQADSRTNQSRTNRFEALGSQPNRELWVRRQLSLLCNRVLRWHRQRTHAGLCQIFKT